MKDEIAEPKRRRGLGRKPAMTHFNLRVPSVIVDSFETSEKPTTAVRDVLVMNHYKRTKVRSHLDLFRHLCQVMRGYQGPLTGEEYEELLDGFFHISMDYQVTILPKEAFKDEAESLALVSGNYRGHIAISDLVKPYDRATTSPPLPDVDDMDNHGESLDWYACGDTEGEFFYFIDIVRLFNWLMDNFEVRESLRPSVMLFRDISPDNINPPKKRLLNFSEFLFRRLS